jgi:hypothetical protein
MLRLVQGDPISLFKKSPKMYLAQTHLYRNFRGKKVAQILEILMSLKNCQQQIVAQ